MSAVALKQTAVPLRNVTAPQAKPAPTTVSVLRPSWPDGYQRDLALALGLGADLAGLIDKLGVTRMRVRKGHPLYRAGDRFTALYVIRSGCCKTVLLSECGKNQVSGFHMSGDVLGITGIGTGQHGCDAIALEDSEVYVLPFDRIEEVSLDHHRFEHHFLCLLSREIARRHDLMVMLGTMRADQRLAAFLLDLSKRYHARGYSSCEFVLRMTREEIGSYLGLTLETVSRLCSRFQQNGMIQVQGRDVKLFDHAALKCMVSAGTVQ
jgi:CRP/FNR family transcriptional regulator